MKTLRIYLDTSVFGGCFDEEFARESLRLLEQIKTGKFRLVMSETVLTELAAAPALVQNVWADIPKGFIETVGSNLEVEDLRQAYLEAKVVGPASATDAEHIALATIARADMSVSWNFYTHRPLRKNRGLPFRESSLGVWANWNLLSEGSGKL